MMKRIVCGLVLLAALAALAGVAFADIYPKTTSATRDIALVEEEEAAPAESGDQAAPTKQADPRIAEMCRKDFPVTLASNKAGEGDLFAIGDKLVLSFTAEKDCYLTILDFTPGGQIVVLFPNKWVADKAVKAGQTVQIPAEGQKYSMKVGGPAGVDVIKAVATEKDVPVYDQANAQLAGPFAVLQDARAATRDILLVDEPATPEEGPGAWAAATLAVLTRGEKPGDGAFGLAQKGDWTVKMWVDRGAFLTGEAMFVKFQSTRPAKIASLIDKGAGGKDNAMLPEEVKGSIEVAPGCVTVLPGKDHKWKLIAATPAGVDTVTAVLKDDKGEEIEVSLTVTVDE